MGHRVQHHTHSAADLPPNMGAADLAAVLILGNASLGTNIEVSTGDTIKGQDAAAGSGLAGSPLTLQAGLGDGIGASGALELLLGPTGNIQVDSAGNARGVLSVDLQAYRNLVTQVASGSNSFIGGGTNCTASGSASAALNAGTATGNQATAINQGVASNVNTFAGSQAKATQRGAFAFGGEGSYDVYASGWNAVCFSGGGSNASGDYSLVLGYQANASGYAAVAIGNDSLASGSRGTAMGRSSIASGTDATAINGATARGVRSFAVGVSAYAKIAATGGIALGQSCTSEVSNAVAFGFSCRARNVASIAGGWGSFADGHSAVSLGNSCLAYAAQSIVLGNSSRSDGTALYSLAGGKQAKTTIPGEVSWSAGRVLAPILGGSQWSIFQLATRTLDATATPLRASSSPLTLLPNKSYSFRMIVNAYDVVNGVAAMWEVTGLIKRDGANNTVLVGMVGDGAPLYNDAGAVAWTIAVTADDVTNESLEVTVTGAAATTIYWDAMIMVSRSGT